MMITMLLCFNGGNGCVDDDKYSEAAQLNQCQKLLTAIQLWRTNIETYLPQIFDLGSKANANV